MRSRSNSPRRLGRTDPDSLVDGRQRNFIERSRSPRSPRSGWQRSGTPQECRFLSARAGKLLEMIHVHLKRGGVPRTYTTMKNFLTQFMYGRGPPPKTNLAKDLKTGLYELRNQCGGDQALYKWIFHAVEKKEEEEDEVDYGRGYLSSDGENGDMTEPEFEPDMTLAYMPNMYQPSATANVMQ